VSGNVAFIESCGAKARPNDDLVTITSPFVDPPNGRPA
jgi:hypothetical protein